MASQPPAGRRSFLLGSAASLGVGLSAGVGTLLAAPQRAHASDTTVLIIGSSTMGGALGKYIMKQLESAGLRTYRQAKASSGLARPDFFDWPKKARELQKEHRPDATVVMFGGNDGQGLFMGKRANPPWIRWNEKAWHETYAARVREFADAVAPDGQHVYWVGMPIMKSSKLDARVQRMNAIYRQAMAERRNGSFIETRSVFAAADGSYAERMKYRGKRQKMRAPDGVHLTHAGAHKLADHIAPTVRWGLAVAL